jgi:hypothetical protein
VSGVGRAKLVSGCYQPTICGQCGRLRVAGVARLAGKRIEQINQICSSKELTSSALRYLFHSDRNSVNMQPEKFLRGQFNYQR